MTADITVGRFSCMLANCPVCGSDLFWEKTAVRFDALTTGRPRAAPWSLGSSSWERASETLLQCSECGLQFKPEILGHEETLEAD